MTLRLRMLAYRKMSGDARRSKVPTTTGIETFQKYSIDPSKTLGKAIRGWGRGWERDGRNMVVLDRVEKVSRTRADQGC